MKIPGRPMPKNDPNFKTQRISVSLRYFLSIHKRNAHDKVKIAENIAEAKSTPRPQFLGKVHQNSRFSALPPRISANCPAEKSKKIKIEHNTQSSEHKYEASSEDYRRESGTKKNRPL